jgi:hypothetical protein
MEAIIIGATEIFIASKRTKCDFWASLFIKNRKNIFSNPYNRLPRIHPKIDRTAQNIFSTLCARVLMFSV